jgi:Flp pilus assembly protein TadG
MAALTGRKRDGHDRGSELVELAIVLPLLLLIVAGIADFGFLFQRYEVVTNAAREGARLAVLKDDGYSIADVKQRVQDYLTVSGLTDGSPTTDVTYAPVTMPSGLVVNVATVSVSYPSRFLFLGPIAGMVGGSGWGAITLKAGSIMRVEDTGS